MSFLSNFNDSNETTELRNEIEDLKAQLRVSNLNLKDREFVLNKKTEEYDFQLSQSRNDFSNLKEKFDKIQEAQRKLEKQNSDLEDRLLKIVQKYEEEQKILLEDLTIAHSQLVEAKMTITNLEKEKEAFRQDCNLAVNLLQCKPGDFVKHSYSTLPVNLKNRLKSLLTDDEVLKLEEDSQTENEYQKQKSNSNSLFKIPIFQPTAAAAMMYMNSTSMQQRTKQLDQDTSANQPTNGFTHEVTVNEENETKNAGKVSSLLIAQLLKKEAEPPSKKSFKLFPYVCMRCRKESVFCSTSVQYDASDLTQQDFSSLSTIKYARQEKDKTNSNEYAIKPLIESESNNINLVESAKEKNTKKNNELTNNILII